MCVCVCVCLVCLRGWCACLRPRCKFLVSRSSCWGSMKLVPPVRKVKVRRYRTLLWHGLVATHAQSCSLVSKHISENERRVQQLTLHPAFMSNVGKPACHCEFVVLANKCVVSCKAKQEPILNMCGCTFGCRRRNPEATSVFRLARDLSLEQRADKSYCASGLDSSCVHVLRIGDCG